jgi:hypothetical protein
MVRRKRRLTRLMETAGDPVGAFAVGRLGQVLLGPTRRPWGGAPQALAPRLVTAGGDRGDPELVEGPSEVARGEQPGEFVVSRGADGPKAQWRRW